MSRSFFSFYVERGMRGDAFLPSAFGDADARRQAVTRAATRAPQPALLAELAAQQAALPDSPARRRALDTLATPGTVAVLTGQQVGLFLGPLYTIYKAATAVVLAETLALETGVPAVPVFWMATEDHDFAEIDHAVVARPGGEPLRLRVEGVGRDDPRQPVAAARLGPDVEVAVALVREALAARPAGAEVAALLAAHYQNGRGFGQAFAGLLGALFADEGLLVFDPRTAAAAALAAPVYRTALAYAGEAAARLQERDAALAAAGLGSQVHVRPDAALVFHHDERGARRVVRLDEAAGLADHVEAAPLGFSSSALLRPIVQDTLFPTAAYVGGPAEVSYFAQAAALYELFGLPVPLVAPRARFRLVDARTQARLAALGLSTADIEQPRDALLLALGARLPAPMSPDAVRAAILDGPRAAFATLPQLLGPSDRELARAFLRTRATIERAADRLAARWARTLALRDEQTAAALHRAQAGLYPDQQPQERVFAFASFAAEAGVRPFVSRLVAAVKPFDPTVQDLPA